MMCKETLTLELAPQALAESLSGMRLCAPEAQQQMQLSCSRVGQLSPVQAYRTPTGVEVFDGFKRARAARALGWPSLRVEVHQIDAPGAKLRLWRCNVGVGLSDLEEAWLVRSLHRDDRLSQAQLAQLFGRHKSWVCRRLALAEGLSDELTADLRLGLVSARAALELGRLPRGNQDEAAQVAMRSGLTTRQTARMVDDLLAAPDEATRANVLSAAGRPREELPSAKAARRRTPGEQLVAEAWSMKRLAARLHARLLERSLESLGEGAYGVVSHELGELRRILVALGQTLDKRLGARGGTDAAH